MQNYPLKNDNPCFFDTGLLISQLGEDVPAKILSGDINAYKGAIAENMVASAFAANGRELYYSQGGRIQS